MKNLWPESFEENQKLSAKSLIEEQASLLPKLTNGMVYAEVINMGMGKEFCEIVRDFAYQFVIKGKFLDTYRFRVLSFAHDITLYPIIFDIDEGIIEELDLEADDIYGLTVDSEKELENLIDRVLKSKRLNEIIGSIIRLSH